MSATRGEILEPPTVGVLACARLLTTATACTPLRVDPCGDPRYVNRVWGLGRGGGSQKELCTLGCFPMGTSIVSLFFGETPQTST